MKPVFHVFRVNGPFDDPAVFARILRERRAVLFDCGNISALDTGHLLKISDIFITHMHIDHFIGIDLVIRAALRRVAPLRIYGPRDIVSCIEGKLKGYSWNLIREYPLKLDVFEINDAVVKHSGFYASDAFERMDLETSGFSSIILDDTLFKVKALQLTHDVPVIAYSLEEDYHININKAHLQSMGFEVGPWLSEFKKAIRRGAPDDMSFDFGGKTITLKEAMQIATITRGQKISYVTDVSPDEINISKIIEFVSGSDTLFCEAYFPDKEIERALERSHLTAALAGKIAREAKVGNIEIMHISPKYIHSADEIYSEVEREFKKGCDL